MTHITVHGIFTVTMLFFIITVCAATGDPDIFGGVPSETIVTAAGGEGVYASPPQPVPTVETASNYTRLEIMPSYLTIVAEPGERKAVTVTIRNRNTKSAHIQPRVRQQPFAGPYVAESSWITVTPSGADIPAGESAKFTVSVLLPKGTLRGMYNSMVTFTDEAYPSAYPQPFPSYIHTLGLNINVAASPVIQISTPYISDQIEAGSEYIYTVDVKNRGSTQLSLNAKLGDDSAPMYGPYGPQESRMDANAFTINAPAFIPPGQNGTVIVKVNVPKNASGYFNGNVDLGIDDPSVRLEESRIQLNFMIWKQPAGGFTKKFMVRSQEPIAIELTSSMPMMGPMPFGKTPTDMPHRDPSFDAILTGPEGNANLVLVEKVIKGSVNLGTDPMLANGDLPGQYQEFGSQYIYTYSAQGKPGQWTLAVMPRNTQSFEYRIRLGGETPAQAPYLFLRSPELPGNVSGT